MTLGILASGNLGFEVLKKLTVSRKVIFVMTDKKSTDIIAYCKDRKIDFFAGNPRNGACDTFIENRAIDVLISINYLFLIEQELINLPKLIAFNIHGSLLPKYRGRTPHVWAIINNEKTTGITAHLIDKGCDTGSILEQIIVEITPDDTGFTVLKKFEQLYYPLIEKVLEKLEVNELSTKNQLDCEATYFGKRTPDDGEINWDWQKERICNWVRAQAHPYPGAFTMHNGEKLIIDEITYSEAGFSYDMPNGLIVSVDPVRVKTPNGVVELNSIRNNTIQLEINKCLEKEEK
jgi:methionyl-tRNA formyltransferase